MTASGADSDNPLFIIVSDVRPDDQAWPCALMQVEDIGRLCAPVLGFEPDLRLESVPFAVPPGRETFVVPAALDFNLWQRESLGQLLAESRRQPSTVIHHDDVDPGHPLLVNALAEQALLALAQIPPQGAGLILVASGHGDPASRAQSYRLMRLLWEQLGFAFAEVAFVRDAQPLLTHVLDQRIEQPLPAVLVFLGQWDTEPLQCGRAILETVKRAHPKAATWIFAAPPGAHPSLTAWFAQRITCLWRENHERQVARVPSAAKRQSTPQVWKVGGGSVAHISGREFLAGMLRELMPATPERVLVKVTWHGYATGTYTDPAALDLLLGALPAPAIVLEGHTSSRNLGGAQFDWETQARQNRAWIRQQEAEYLRRTGLADVLARHQAQFVNVTEAFWDEDWPADRQVEFIPNVLAPFRGCPLISFAKFKGPTRLSISNLFGLIPEPMRSAWHGPNITWFARVCCDLAKLYGSAFELVGLVEALFYAVRWNCHGLYRSRWGNYDLLRDAALVTASRGLVAADILASRMQGQDVNRSAFFDVVRQELGWDREAADGGLPEGKQTILT